MMKTYIWEYLPGLTQNFHDGGALIIVTNREPQEVFDQYVEEYNEDEGNWREPMDTVELPKPTFSYSCDPKMEEKMFIFEDSGCCG